jgi:hypothetical protein
MGRLNELRLRDDAERIAYTIPRRNFDDYGLTLYASRAALEAFCKPGSFHHALVKAEVPANMLTNRNTQRAKRGA